MKQQNQQIRNQSRIEEQLANYMTVLRGLKEERAQEIQCKSTSLGLSPKKQGAPEIALNNKPVMINSEEQINRRGVKALDTGSFVGDGLRSSIGSHQPGAMVISQPFSRL